MLNYIYITKTRNNHEILLLQKCFAITVVPKFGLFKACEDSNSEAVCFCFLAMRLTHVISLLKQPFTMRTEKGLVLIASHTIFCCVRAAAHTVVPFIFAFIEFWRPKSKQVWNIHAIDVMEKMKNTSARNIFFSSFIHKNLQFTRIIKIIMRHCQGNFASFFIVYFILLRTTKIVSY